ncbi:MAG: patatin-like phospholipase family protein, partial [Pseudomonadales bacterium]
MHSRRLMSFILACSACSSATGAFASASLCRDLGELQRPSLGLVLGGGGARGAAHIGVIRKLEELNIPVDYVAGTSMGSLIGALYATGMSADELEQTISKLDWDDLFTDSTRRADRTLRRKRDDDLSLFGPKLGIGRDSKLLPTGALSGQKISFLFESLVQGRVHVDDFDHLPIPFRAVAADIATGDAVVLGTGDLALAMRASMSVPGAFTPVPLRQHLLVDGGIANNLPINVVREMGAKRLIAVEVGSPLTPRDELDSVLPVLTQMSTLLIRSNVEAQLATLGGDDLLIEPAIGTKVTSADFDKFERAIAIGYAAADQLEADLGRYSVSNAEYQA